ncbi:MAG: VacJ family lipoprotein [Aquimonas sp.]|nr:VacJ family lipoprotein [Aquimonas sp.]
MRHNPLFTAALLLATLAAAPAALAQQETPLEEPLTTPANDSMSDLDPWQGFNRRMHTLNMGVDRIVFRPAAVGYQKVTPPVVRAGVSNFFRNLGQPVVALNLLLQGRPGQAGTALGRFGFNAALGFGGFLDPASSANIPFRDADIGQTLGRYGWKRSRYLVMPLFGPGTVRDVGGRLTTTRISPISRLASEVGPGVTFVYGLDARASVLQFESLLAEAEDDYLLIRDAYLQRRRCYIDDCSGDLPDYLLPDYEYELPDIDFRILGR